MKTDIVVRFESIEANVKLLWRYNEKKMVRQSGTSDIQRIRITSITTNSCIRSCGTGAVDCNSQSNTNDFSDTKLRVSIGYENEIK